MGNKTKRPVGRPRKVEAVPIDKNIQVKAPPEVWEKLDEMVKLSGPEMCRSRFVRELIREKYELMIARERTL